MTCRELMTSDPAFCVPDDSVVTAAMLMKNHDIGSVPIVTSRQDMTLIGIVTDRDITVRVVAEQRDYYRTHVTDVMSSEPVACRVDDDRDEVVSAMAKRQVRRVPVVDGHNRLVGIISQADVARADKPDRVGAMVEDISEPASLHPTNGGTLVNSGLMMIAGGLGLGAGLAYLISPRWARDTTRQVVEKLRS